MNRITFEPSNKFDVLYKKVGRYGITLDNVEDEISDTYYIVDNIYNWDYNGYYLTICAENIEKLF